MKRKRRILSLLLSGAMLFSICTPTVFAETPTQDRGQTITEAGGLCEHHPEHNADCGYTEGTAGTPCVHEHTADCYEEVTNCVHEHDEDCYPEEGVSGNEATPSGAQKREPENCPHICDEKSGCITKELNCQHEHDDECGYSPATAGTPCGYVCELCGAGDNTPSNAKAVTVASVQAMIDALPNAEEITEDNAEDVKAQLDAIDEAKEKLSDEEIDELDFTRYAEAAAALGALAAPMLLADDSPDEQFSLKPGDTYYFDLSAMGIPGTANSGNSDGAAPLPDMSLHYVPFTYVGTINAYSRNSEGVSTDDTVKPYAHSLFVADYNVTHTVSWDDLNTASLIFGKNCAVGGVDYTLRAPSVGSGSTGSDDSKRGTPQSNEWDMMLNKNSEYIQNWNKMSSWGQDAFPHVASYRAVRGYASARRWSNYNATYSNPRVGFRPVLEVLNPDTLGSDGLKVVTLDLGGGKLGGSSEDIQIIVKTGSTFTAPASDGLTRPDGDTGSYFVWLGSNGKLYAPGASVPADVTKLTAQFTLSEQFSLTPGGRYYFDLSGEKIPGTANGNLPDSTLHYVPFTYAGTIEAYKLTSATATTEEYAQREKYPHSLFVADYVVTHTVSWNDLNAASLIFGKNYASGGVDYTLRAPSVGSNSTGSGDSDPGTPQSNEWDTILDKDNGYIQNWNEMSSWGQDTFSGDASRRAFRGYLSARRYIWNSSSFRYAYCGFRPVLEILNADTLNSDGLKVVTLDLGGGKLGGSSDAIQIIVKTGSTFTAPASDGLTRPDGDTGSYFVWLGSNGKLYAPGASVPADVTKLTAQFTLSEQFSLTPGGRYYFDLSGASIPGTVNTGNEDGAVSLPDTTLHYVPFTYAGTVNAYSRNSEGVSTDDTVKPYAHSLFVADYNVTHTVSWNDLNTANLIFGKSYVAGGVDYTLRAPSVGSDSTGSYSSERGTPQSNEWDTMLNKNSRYIQNWNKMYSWGQDTFSDYASSRAVRGYNSARHWRSTNATYSYPYVGFRPVLEVLNPDTLNSDGLKVVTLDLGGGKLGGSSDAIQIIVKNGSTFTAPASDGMTRPDGDSGNYFMWLDGNGNSYKPGDSVPADVTKLTVQWTAPAYTVTLNTNGGTIADGKDVTGYTYGVGATLPTDVTRTGYTFKGWYDNENLTGSPVTAISNTETGNKEYWAKWTVNQYTITYDLAGGTVEGNPDTYTIETEAFTLKNPTKSGYTFTGWSGTGLDGENNMTVTIPTGSTGNRTYTAHWRYNGSGSGGGTTGGGSSSGSGSSSDNGDSSGSMIVERPDQTKPEIPTTSQTKPVKPDKNGNTSIDGNAVQDAINKATADAKKNGTTANGIAVTVPIQNAANAKNLSITIKAQTLDKLVTAKVRRFEITTNGLPSFGFTLDTLKMLNAQSKGGDLILRVSKAAVTSAEAKAAIRTRPVYEFSLVDGKEAPLTDWQGKTVSVKLPYAPAANEQAGNLYAVYVNDKGKVQWLTKSSYDADQKAVIFEAQHFSIYGVGYKNPVPNFTDINGHWAKEHILFTVSRGLFSGTSETTFSPNTTLTRGMFVTALGRLAGIDPADYQNRKFTDVKANAYYAPYVNWAASKGIVGGTTSSTFAPDSNITREQMAVIMKNYADKMGYSIPKTLEAVTFADNAQISSWAKDAVKAMQQAGVLSGKTDNRFDPQGNATRAEAATVLHRFVEVIIDPQTANGWQQNDSGEWSYYKDGEPVKGWLSDDQKWYWLDKATGKMFSGGWKQIDGKWYYFYADGSMAVSTKVDGYEVGTDGARR